MAHSLGYLYFDTGVMYRAVTWATLARAIDIEDIETVSSLAESLVIEVKPDGPDDGRQYTVLADGQDITWAIRSPDVEAANGCVSSYPRPVADTKRRWLRVSWPILREYWPPS